MTENNLSNEALLDLEQTLKSRLRPVTPSQNFIGSLKRKLEESTTAQRQHRLAVKMLVVAVGLTVGLAIFLIGRGYLLKNRDTGANGNQQ